MSTGLIVIHDGNENREENGCDEIARDDMVFMVEVIDKNDI